MEVTATLFCSLLLICCWTCVMSKAPLEPIDLLAVIEEVLDADAAVFRADDVERAFGESSGYGDISGGSFGYGNASGDSSGGGNFTAESSGHDASSGESFGYGNASGKFFGSGDSSGESSGETDTSGESSGSGEVSVDSSGYGDLMNASESGYSTAGAANSSFSYRISASLPYYTFTNVVSIGQDSGTAPSSAGNSTGTVDCEFLPNGLRAIERCGPSFVICSNGITSTFSCPDNLVFDPNTLICDYRNRCGKGSNFTDSSTAQAQNPGTFVSIGDILSGSAPTKSENYQVPFYTIASQSDATTSGSSNGNMTGSGTVDCEFLPDGLRAVEPCGPSFVICSNGITSTFNCADNLVFDPVNLVCMYRNQCGQSSSAKNAGTVDSGSSLPEKFTDAQINGQPLTNDHNMDEKFYLGTGGN